MHLWVCTAKMNMGDAVDFEDYVSRPDEITAAEVCGSSVELCSHIKAPLHIFSVLQSVAKSYLKLSGG
ncbi:hypothetical protein ACJIZ3_024520 [Penstemon smallii]|uniref:Uncharacterized protein n=1 Tax=Penstemon smallii TaxID=265156 RepID=A0ABD3TS44_9LAMI